jgi:hypothetical protein
MDSEKIDLKALDAILEEYKGKKGSVIPILRTYRAYTALCPRKRC